MVGPGLSVPDASMTAVGSFGPISPGKELIYVNITIQRPSDKTEFLLCVASQNVQSHKYHSKEQFVEDAELLYTNSLQYNGVDHAVTNTARKLMEVMKEELNEVGSFLCQILMI